MQVQGARLYTHEEVCVREGAWINAKTGAYSWVDDHARWLRRNPDQAAQLGLPEDIIAELGEIGWDITPLAERVIVLFKAMDAGFIRARGHGAYVTFEFSIPWADAVRGAQKFMAENFGPSMACRFNSLNSNQTIEFTYGRVADRLGEADLSFLLPPWKRPRFRPPLPRPFIVSNIAGDGWICWSLPGDLEAHALVDLLREALPQEGGWLALADGRTWKLTPDTPPVLRVYDREALKHFEICPDCGWPRIGTDAPCQCHSQNHSCHCGLPLHWPTPMYDHVHLDGRVTYVPHVAAYAHQCVPWPQVVLSDLNGLLGRR